jgi:hypothetical protein
MTTRELLSTILAQGPSPSPTIALEIRLIFRTLRDNLHLVKLRDGARICDLSDMRALCLELVEELTPVTCMRRGPSMLRAEQPRDWNECPRCGHTHQEAHECGVQIGPGLVCHCQREVAVPA